MSDVVLTALEIAEAKQRVEYVTGGGQPLHEHDDCIRIAYEWLDAQTKIKTARRRRARSLKSIIQKWGGRYISSSDVEVAAYLHPQIVGRYPYFNIGARLVEPSRNRLDGIGEANAHR